MPHLCYWWVNKLGFTLRGAAQWGDCQADLLPALLRNNTASGMFNHCATPRHPRGVLSLKKARRITFAELRERTEKAGWVYIFSAVLDDF